MLNEEENRFVEYWSKNRLRQKKTLKQLAIGLPVGVLFAVAIFINFTSGWYKRATMIFNAYPSVRSLILVLIVAVLSIVVFVSVFSVKVNWERNEQRYRELMLKKDK
jgi:hypothetical protein